jgi:hypothetical protein
MARLIAPNDTMREVDIQGARTGLTARYRWGRDGAVHVSNAAHVKALKEAGFTVVGVAPDRPRGGFICPSCGFRPWFRACSRCGSECVKDD